MGWAQAEFLEITQHDFTWKLSWDGSSMQNGAFWYFSSVDIIVFTYYRSLGRRTWTDCQLRSSSWEIISIWLLKFLQHFMHLNYLFWFSNSGFFVILQNWQHIYLASFNVWRDFNTFLVILDPFLLFWEVSELSYPRCRKSLRKNGCYQILLDALHQLNFLFESHILNANWWKQTLLKYKALRIELGTKTCFIRESACFYSYDLNYCYGLNKFLRLFVLTSVYKMKLL